MKRSRILAGLATAAALAVPFAAGGASAVSSSAVPESGALFGVAGDMGVQATSKRTFSLHRVYEHMGRNVINHKVRDDAAKGRTTVLSLYSNARWPQIAAGARDKELVREAKQLKAFGKPIIVAFHHEPENDERYGRPSDYVAAFRRFVTVYRQQGASNVSFAWVVMSWNFRPGGPATKFYPGDDYVDFIAPDGYNSSGCRVGPAKPKRFHTFQQVFQRTYDFTVAHNKMMIVAEYGSVEYPTAPGLKAKFFEGIPATAKQWPALKGLLYFNHGIGGSSKCHWSVDTSGSSVAAFVKVANDPYFHNMPYKK